MPRPKQDLNPCLPVLSPMLPVTATLYWLFPQRGGISFGSTLMIVVPLQNTRMSCSNYLKLRLCQIDSWHCYFDSQEQYTGSCQNPGGPICTRDVRAEMCFAILSKLCFPPISSWPFQKNLSPPLLVCFFSA